MQRILHLETPPWCVERRLGPLVEHSHHPAIRRPGIARVGRGVAVEIEDQYVAFPDGLAIKGLMDRYTAN